MPAPPIRPPAVAGTWYPGTRAALTREVDALVGAAEHAGPANGAARRDHRAARGHDVLGRRRRARLQGRGRRGSGGHRARRSLPLRRLRRRRDLRTRGVRHPVGRARVDEAAAAALMAASPIIRPHASAHAREHSLEMQLPFLQRVLPDVPIVPLAIGFQTSETIAALGDALAAALGDRRALLVASTDLSHYFDSATATALDARVADCVERFDAEGLLAEVRALPRTRARAATSRAAAARRSPSCARPARSAPRRRACLKYAHSGDISGDHSNVVGYLAAGLWKA